MKEVFRGEAAKTRKLATVAFSCSTLAMSFLLGCCIRCLVIWGFEFMVRHCTGYLTLLSC